MVIDGLSLPEIARRLSVSVEEATAHIVEATHWTASWLRWTDAVDGEVCSVVREARNRAAGLTELERETLRRMMDLRLKRSSPSARSMAMKELQGSVDSATEKIGRWEYLQRELGMAEDGKTPEDIVSWFADAARYGDESSDLSQQVPSVEQVVADLEEVRRRETELRAELNGAQ